MSDYPWYSMRGCAGDCMGEFRSGIAAKQWGYALYQVIKMDHPDLKESCYDIWLANAPAEILDFTSRHVIERLKEQDPLWHEYIGYVFRFLFTKEKGAFGILYGSQNIAPLRGVATIPALGFEDGLHKVIALRYQNFFQVGIDFWMRPEHPRFEGWVSAHAFNGEFDSKIQEFRSHFALICKTPFPPP